MTEDNGFTVRERGASGTARADWVCNSRKCRQEDGSAPVYELPLSATRCPVCGSKRLVRLFNSVHVSHGIAKRTDAMVQPDYERQKEAKDAARTAQGATPTFAVPMSKIQGTLTGLAAGKAAPTWRTYGVSITQPTVAAAAGPGMGKRTEVVGRDTQEQRQAVASAVVEGKAIEAEAQKQAQRG